MSLAVCHTAAYPQSSFVTDNHFNTLSVHHHDGPWQELSDVGDFHAASMALVNPEPPLVLEDVYANPMRCQALLPPSRVLGGVVDRCLIGEGSIIRVCCCCTACI